MNLNPIRANMNEVNFGTKSILFSYKVPVASFEYPNGAGTAQYYQTDKKWSNTTTRHIKQWLNGNGAMFKPQEYFDNLVK